MCSRSVHVAPFGALRFVGSRYHGFHPWLQHAVSPGLLPPKGGALDKHSAQKKNVTLGAKGDIAALRSRDQLRNQLVASGLSLNLNSTPSKSDPAMLADTTACLPFGS